MVNCVSYNLYIHVAYGSLLSHVFHLLQCSESKWLFERILPYFLIFNYIIMWCMNKKHLIFRGTNIFLLFLVLKTANTTSITKAIFALIRDKLALIWSYFYAEPFTLLNKPLAQNRLITIATIFSCVVAGNTIEPADLVLRIQAGILPHQHKGWCHVILKYA